MNKSKIRIFIREYWLPSIRLEPSFWYEDYISILIRNKHFLIK